MSIFCTNVNSPFTVCNLTKDEVKTDKKELNNLTIEHEYVKKMKNETLYS